MIKIDIAAGKQSAASWFERQAKKAQAKAAQVELKARLERRFQLFAESEAGQQLLAKWEAEEIAKMNQDAQTILLGNKE